jgi:hypothetical protein
LEINGNWTMLTTKRNSENTQSYIFLKLYRLGIPYLKYLGPEAFMFF